jgi:RNA polymerase sigma-70 factor (ECF subfamily)
VVLAAAEGNSSRRGAALETLCLGYWEPLYAYLRRSGHPVHDAEDLTQGFFEHLLSQDWLAGVSPAKGKFRSFLLASLKHYLCNEHDRANAAKRGGGQRAVPLDTSAAETHLIQDSAPARSPESQFDRQWALTVLKRAGDRLRQELETADKAAHFKQLGVFLSREGKGDEYQAIGAVLHLSPGAVAVAVHRLRQRWRDQVRREIADTVGDARELEDERRYLLELLVAEV